MFGPISGSKQPGFDGRGEKWNTDTTMNAGKRDRADLDDYTLKNLMVRSPRWTSTAVLADPSSASQGLTIRDSNYSGGTTSGTSRRDARLDADQAEGHR